MILLDADVILDVALDRRPNSDASAALLTRLERRPYRAFVAWHTLANLYYMLRPSRGTGDARDFLLSLATLVVVAPTNTEDLRFAGSLEMPDFDGEKLLAAKEQRVGDLITVAPSTPIRMALSTLTAHDIGQLPVVLEGECVGSLTETRLMALVIDKPELLDKSVETVMGAPFPVLDGHVDSEEIMHIMKRGNPACLVRQDGKLLGIVTRYDVVRVLTA